MKNEKWEMQALKGIVEQLNHIVKVLQVVTEKIVIDSCREFGEIKLRDVKEDKPIEPQTPDDPEKDNIIRYREAEDPKA